MLGCGLAPTVPFAVQAADITIPSGTTVTTTQTLTDAGDTGTVESGGTIDVTDQDGLVLDNDNQTATNNGHIEVERTAGTDVTGIGSDGPNSTISNTGTISTMGNRAYGIASVDDNVSITNSGSIITNGNSSFGILSTDDDATLVNSGTITTTGNGSDAILSDDEDVTATNSGLITTSGISANGFHGEGARAGFANQGTITTTGDGSHGVDIDADSSTVTNTGNISVSGENSEGIDTNGENTTVINSGTILATGRQGDGVDHRGDNSRVSSSGSITVSGEDSNGLEASGDDLTVSNSGTIKNTGTTSGSSADTGHGISVDGGNMNVTNSGTVFSDNGSSIYLDGEGSSLTLNQGSLLQGLITFTDPSTASLNYAVDRTAVYTFSGIPGALDTNGLTYSVSGSTVTIINPDDFRLGSLGDTFKTLTREITGTLEGQLDLNRLEETAFTATNGGAADGTASRNGVWLSPFGGVLNRNGSDAYNHSFAGLMAGGERELSANLRTGFTAGFSLGRTESEDDIHSSETYSVFAGGYVTRNWQNTFADVSLIGGYLNSDDQVTILNNMVNGGLQDISLGYDYIYLTPSLRLGRLIDLAQGTLIPSIRVRYSGLWQTGDANEPVTGLSISNRSLHVLEVRGQTAYDFAPVVRDNGSLHFGLKAGVDGVFTLGDSVDSNLTGVALNLSVDNDDAVLRGFGQANAVWQTNGGTKFLASAEGGYDTQNTLAASIRLGMKVNF